MARPERVSHPRTPLLDVLLGLELGNAARDPRVVTESLRSSWEIFPGVTRALATLSDVALAQPELQTLTLAGLFGIREGFCKGIAAEIACVRARWWGHSHTLVTFEWELGKICGKLGRCWLLREEKCSVARTGGN